MSNTLQEALKSASSDLYQSYQKSLTLAMEGWLPAIEAKNDSQNGYPHIKSVEKHLNAILFSDENRDVHNFELSAIELYVLLTSVLLHDIGKQKENRETKDLGQKHSYFSYKIITDNWAELGIVSKQIADVIALISFFHDYESKKKLEAIYDKNKSSEVGDVIAKVTDVEKRLNNYIKIEHNGIVRAKALASLLFLSDHMDGSLSRTVPQFVMDKPGIVGEFRNEVQSVYLDLKNKMICTSINARLLADEKDGNADAKFFSEKKYKKSLPVKKDLKEKRDVPVLDEEGDDHLIKLIDAKSSEEGHFQCKIINTLIRDVKKNKFEIRMIRNSLYEIGMPVLDWFLECNGMLFKVEKSKKTTISKKFKYLKVVPTFEPILTVGFLKRIFRGMVEISGSSLGDNYYDYVALLNYAREPSYNMHKVKCAVNRLAILHNNFCRTSNDKVKFYCDAKYWNLKIDSKDIKKQRAFLQKSFITIFDEISKSKKDPESGNEKNTTSPFNNCGKIVYDVGNSIVFSNPLDYLLCRDLQHYSSPTKKNLKISKYQIVKLLKKECTATTCKNECDECHYLHAKLDGAEKVYLLGGLLLSNRKKPNKPGSDDIQEMLGVKRFVPGSGNIVIAGSYGTGKSTLAFQMASTCANEINKGISVYYSLESTRHDIVENYIIRAEEVKEKKDAKEIKEAVKQRINFFEWYPKNEEDDKKDSANLSIYLKTSLLKGRETILPQILFPKLTPKNIVDASSLELNQSVLFEKRFQEIKYMLSATKEYNDTRKPNDPRVKMIVIDSLNAFADRPLLRGEVHRLFDLFTSYHMLGIFILEESVQEDFVGTNYNDSIQYRADGVILLRNSNFQSHHESYLEIRKMRNQRHIFGQHLYKIRPLKYSDNKKNNNKMGNIMNREVEIYPSLHYLISATERLEDTDSTEPYKRVLPLKDEESHNIFHIKELNYILPENIIDRGTGPKDINYKSPSSQVITITGPSGFYKSDLVINALFAGMILEKENGLLIRLNDRDLFEEDGFRMSKELFACFPAEITQDVGNGLSANGLRVINLERSEGNDDIDKNASINKNEGNDDINQNASVYKTRTKTWHIINNDDKNTLTELIFTSGALKPEEFIDTVLTVIQNKNIKRVALIDLKTIGISYPFLINSETSGKMFIPAFVHIMRNHKIHLFMSTSISQVKDSASEINKACELSDALITIKQNEQDEDGSQKTFIESSGNKVRDKVSDKRYYIEQEAGSYYCCKISCKKSGTFYTPKLSPFVLKKDNV